MEVGGCMRTLRVLAVLRGLVGGGVEVTIVFKCRRGLLVAGVAIESNASTLDVAGLHAQHCGSRRQ